MIRGRAVQVAVLDLGNGGVIGDHGVGEVQNAARMATVHHHRQMAAGRHLLDEVVVYVVVPDLARGLIVHGNHSLIHPIGLVSVVVRNGSTVAAVVQKEAVAALGVVHEPMNRTEYLCSSGRRVMTC